MINRALCKLFSKPLNQNMRYAKQAVAEVRDKIKNSNTFLALSNDGTTQKELEITRVADIVKEIRGQQQLNVFQKAKLALDKRAGNCLEMANATYLSLIHKPIKGNIEIFEIINGDHAFNVLNRAKDSRSNDPTTWGKDAIVVDSWANKVYPAEEIQSKLKDYRCITFFGNNNDCKHAELIDYDPKKHWLRARYNSNRDIRDPLQKQIKPT